MKKNESYFRVGTSIQLIAVGLLCLLCGQSNAQSDPCLQALYDADSNGDRRVDQDEFVIFVQLLQPQLPASTDFETLPLSLQSTFNTLACNCRETDADDCCIGENAHLPNKGTGPGEVPTEAQQNRLSRICYFMEDTLDRFPTEAPVPTAVPTQEPTISTGITMAPTVVTNITTVPPASPDDDDETVSTATVSYTIVVRNGAISSVAYEADLISAMNYLVINLTNRRLLRTRRLQQILLPTSIVSITTKDGFTMTPSLVDGLYYDGVGPCPADLGDPATDLCQEVVAAISMYSVENDEMINDLELSVNVAILKGRLQASLQRTRPNSVVTVLTGQATNLIEVPLTATSDVDDSTKITTGAAAGIVVSACAVAGVLGFLLLTQRRQTTKENEKGDRQIVQDLTPVSDQTLSCELQAAECNDVEQAVTTKHTDNAELSHVVTSEHPNSHVQQTNTTSYPVRTVTTGKESSRSLDSEHSAQSESGWSTDNEHSSMGTADSNSIKANNDEERLMTTKMVDLQDFEIAHSQSRDMDSSQCSVAIPPALSVKDLEQAIMIGDWAAVGASAAALASGAFDADSDNGDPYADTDGSYLSGSLGLSMTEEWRSRETGGASWQMATDTNKATQLDQLIERGDWEAVIQAAARFEAEQNEGGDSTIEYLPSASSISVLDDDQESTVQSQSPMVSRSPDTPVKESSFRSQVIELIKQVVPEELDNVDDMLEQFEGREEDLIDTLKAMEINHQPQNSTPPKKKRIP